MKRYSRLFLVRLASIAMMSVLAHASADAGVLLVENFKGREVGPYQGLDAGASRVNVWRGPKDGFFGAFELIKVADNPSGPVLAVRDSAAGANQAPALILDWPAVAAGSSGAVVVEFRCKVIPPSPAAEGASGHYRVDINVGGSWAKAIANVILEKDQVRLHDGKKAATVGKYPRDQWNAFRLTVDMAERTFSLSMNDRLLANGIPWVDGETPGFKSVSIKSDMMPIDHAGEVVLLLSDMRVSTQK